MENLKIRYLELTSLFETNKILNASLDLQSILDNLLLTAMGRLMIGQGAVFIRMEDSVVELKALKGLPASLLGRVFPMPHLKGNPIFITDHKAAGDPLYRFLETNDLQILIPMISNGKEIGLVAFGKKFIQSEYNPDEINFLESLVSSAAIAVDKGLLFEELKSTNRKLDKKIQELNTLFEISRELKATLDIQKILNVLSFAVMGELLVNRCLIVLLDHQQLKVQLVRGLDASVVEIEKQLQNSACVKSLSQHPVLELTPEVCQESGLGFLKQLELEYCVAMSAQDVFKGFLGIGKKVTGETLSETELGFLETLANDAVSAIENAQMVEQMLEKQRMEEELKIARDIQKRLLPEYCPHYDRVEIAARNYSCTEVGGDYYDCLPLDASRLGIAIADVSGKSTPAALLMANLQASLRALASDGKPVQSIVKKINDLIYQNTTSDKFITFFYGELLVRESSLTFTNAGHNPPILFHQDGSYQFLKEGGIILGMMPHVAYEESTVLLHPNDVLVLYTDGITEAQNQEEEEFGEERLIQKIYENLLLPAEEISEKILEAVKTFSNGADQTDDMTLLVVKIKENV
ncbi:MAG: SpoIIE family protein phosphatase [Calditrichaeota bacterium]|nr:SpoIIE family protein phosphatase [Calditrichota bacterium]